MKESKLAYADIECLLKTVRNSIEGDDNNTVKNFQFQCEIQGELYRLWEEKRKMFLGNIDLPDQFVQTFLREIEQIIALTNASLHEENSKLNAYTMHLKQKISVLESKMSTLCWERSSAI